MQDQKFHQYYLKFSTRDPFGEHGLRDGFTRAYVTGDEGQEPQAWTFNLADYEGKEENCQSVVSGRVYERDLKRWPFELWDGEDAL